MPNPQPQFIPGLVSVSFRNLPPERVVALAADSGLKSIEWGGDVHVPHGDLVAARRVRQLCQQAALTVSAYGSYYRAGTAESLRSDFSAIVETARELGTRSIRVWAGNLASTAAPSEFRQAVIADLQKICASAAKAGCSISLEFHGGTVTDTADSTLELITDAGATGLSTYWQPAGGMSVPDCLASLRTIQPHLRNLHVFHWWPDHLHRLPLAEGADDWRQYLTLVAGIPSPEPRHASLEFVRGDDPQQLRDDAKTLLDWLEGLTRVGSAQ